VSQAAGENMEPLKVDGVIGREEWKGLLVIKGFKFLFQKLLAENTEGWFCNNKIVNASYSVMTVERF